MCSRGHRKDRVFTMYKSRKTRGKGAAFYVILVLIVLALVYLAGVAFFHGHFYPGTEINSVGCGFDSADKARKSLRSAVNNFTITLKERGGNTETIKGSDTGLDSDIKGSLDKQIKSQNAFAWPVDMWKQNAYTVKMTVTLDQEKLEKAVDKLDIVRKPGTREPENAVIEYDSDKKEYVAKDGDPGNIIDRDALLEAVEKGAEDLKTTIDLSKAGAYEKAQYTADSAVVKDALDKANRYVKAEATYEFGDDKVTVDSDQIAQWIKISDDFKVSFYQSQVQKFVSDLADKYDTIYKKTRTFKTSYGYDIKTARGDYGWWMNRVAEKDDLIDFIKKGKAGVKKPVYYQTAMQYGDDDIGDTYVEVNLTKQHVLLYVKGKLVDESDCVSGKTSTPTPAGVFSVTYRDHKHDDHVVELKGENYTSPVDMFIPFYGNVGFHDASWRSVFGGNIYKQNGSHGCVNLPYHMAQSIYENVDKDYPVIVYEDPNVPSATTGEDPAQASGNASGN